MALCDKYSIPRETVDTVFHGTTIATNAILEHDGAVTGMITTGGYRDILHIGRHQRPQHYSIVHDMPWHDRPLVKKARRGLSPLAGPAFSAIKARWIISSRSGPAS